LLDLEAADLTDCLAVVGAARRVLVERLPELGHAGSRDRDHDKRSQDCGRCY
jgi:hypothetical protein